MIRNAVLMLVLCCDLALGQAYAQGRPVLVTDPETPLQFRGFLTKPHPGSAWFIVFRSDVDVVFLKRPESKLHSFYVRMSITQLPENVTAPEDALELIKKEFKGGENSAARFAPLKFDFTPDATAGNMCSRYIMQAEDSGAAGANGKVLLLEAAGLVCVHPDSKRHVIHATYSERGGPLASSAVLKSEGETFVRGMKFSPLP